MNSRVLGRTTRNYTNTAEWRSVGKFRCDTFGPHGGARNVHTKPCDKIKSSARVVPYAFRCTHTHTRSAICMRNTTPQYRRYIYWHLHLRAYAARRLWGARRFVTRRMCVRRRRNRCAVARRRFVVTFGGRFSFCANERARHAPLVVDCVSRKTYIVSQRSRNACACLFCVPRLATTPTARANRPLKYISLLYVCIRMLYVQCSVLQSFALARFAYERSSESVCDIMLCVCDVCVCMTLELIMLKSVCLCAANRAEIVFYFVFLEMRVWSVPFLPCFAFQYINNIQVVRVYQRTHQISLCNRRDFVRHRSQQFALGSYQHA